jgi:hypothetical protein
MPRQAKMKSDTELIKSLGRRLQEHEKLRAKELAEEEFFYYRRFDEVSESMSKKWTTAQILDGNSKLGRSRPNVQSVELPKDPEKRLEMLRNLSKVEPEPTSLEQ